MTTALQYLDALMERCRHDGASPAYSDLILVREKVAEEGARLEREEAEAVAGEAHEAALIARAERAESGFKNFHRSLCERFDYAHDERDWARDLVSLEEHIAKAIGAAGQAAMRTLHSMSYTYEGGQLWRPPLGRTVTVRYDLSPAETEGAIRAKLIELGWTPPGGPVVQWRDKWDSAHVMTADAAARVLRKLYDEWPGGLEEVESALRAARPVPLSAELDAVDDPRAGMVHVTIAAAPAVQPTEGWVLMPEKPTDELLAILNPHLTHTRLTRYKALLAARPAAPEAAPQASQPVRFGWALFDADGHWQSWEAVRTRDPGAWTDPQEQSFMDSKAALGQPLHWEPVYRLAGEQASQPLCHCKSRPADQCPGQWEPGCDLGNSENHVQVASPELHAAINAALAAPAPQASQPAPYDACESFKAYQAAARLNANLQAEVERLRAAGEQASLPDLKNAREELTWAREAVDCESDAFERITAAITAIDAALAQGGKV